MHLHKQMKMDARRAMTNNWGKALSIVFLTVSIYLLFAILESLINILLGVDIYGQMDSFAAVFSSISNSYLMSAVITGGLSLGSLIIMTPLSLGILQWYFHLTYGQSDDVVSIFTFFSTRKMFFRSVWLQIITGVRMFLWTLLFSLPSVFMYSMGIYLTRMEPSRMQAVTVVLCFFGGFILSIVAAIFLVILFNGYFLARYLLLDSDLTARQALKKSIRMMAGNRLQLFWFTLSFVGWFFLCILVIPVLYVLPYYNTSRAIYARFLIERAARAETFVSSATQEYTPPMSSDFSVKEDAFSSPSTPQEETQNME